MRQNKDDKRVLRSGNGRQSNASRRIIRRNNKNNFNARPVMSRDPVNRRKKKRKTSKTLMIVMIVALIAFVIGAGIGVSLSFDNGDDDNQPQFENVTKEMTIGLNDTKDVYFEENVDDVDYNENQASQLDVQYTYSDNN